MMESSGNYIALYVITNHLRCIESLPFAPAIYFLISIFTCLSLFPFPLLKFCPVFFLFHFHPVFVLFSSCFRPVFVLFSSCFRPVFVLFSSCFRPVFVLFSSCFRPVFVLFSYRIALQLLFPSSPFPPLSPPRPLPAAAAAAAATCSSPRPDQVSLSLHAQPAFSRRSILRAAPPRHRRRKSSPPFSRFSSHYSPSFSLSLLSLSASFRVVVAATTRLVNAPARRRRDPSALSTRRTLSPT